MSYFTVVATDSKTGHEKRYTGIRAPSQAEAIKQVAVNGNKHMVYKAWMSKYGRDENFNEWVKQSQRSFWAALARRGRKSHRRHRSHYTEFLRAWQIGCDQWSTTASVFGLTRPNKDVLHD